MMTYRETVERIRAIIPAQDGQVTEVAVQVALNQRDHYKELWEQSCQAVAELCDLAGAPPDSIKDLWTLRECIARRSDGTANVSFFQQLNSYLETLKDSPRSDEEVQLQIVAWVRGFAAGAGK